MNLFNETNKNNSYLLSSKGSSRAFRTCTPCCPYDTKHLPHPQINSIDTNVNQITSNSDACCLSKLQVDCRIQCEKKKTKHKKNKRYNSIHSSPSTKRSISSSSQLSPNRKRNKFGSSTHTNNNYDITSSSESEQSFSSNRSKMINRNIRDLKTSIDNLTQLMTHQQTSISFLDKLRRFFTLFKSTSSKSPNNFINEECCQILERNHLTKQNLLSIYNLFDKNEMIFLNWLRTIMPEYFLPLLLNYVKHFDSISTDNE